MDARQYLQSEVRRLADAAKAITRKAEDEQRPLSDDEKSTIEAQMRDIASHKSRMDEMEDRDKLQKAIESATAVGGNPTDAPVEPKTLGEAFTKSEGYKALIDRGLKGRWSTGPVEFGRKLTDAGLSVEATTLAGGTLPLQPQVVPGIITPYEQPLTIAALFGQGVATQNTIVYLEETTTTPGALAAAYTSDHLPGDAVLTSEGAAKPAAFVDFTKRSVSLDKIAAFLPVADEMLEDEPQIASYINGRLQVFVRQAEEAYLMAELLAASIGSAAAGDISGANKFDAIAAGIYAVQNSSGLTPDALVINPVDFWKMSVTKSAVSGDYFSGGPYAGPARNPWGLRTVITNAVAAGTPVVGAFNDAATVWRKGGLSVEASNSHADFFRKNLTALRAEERLGLAIYRAKAFCEVTLP